MVSEPGLRGSTRMVGVDPNLRDVDGFTAPMLACEYGNEAAIAEMLNCDVQHAIPYAGGYEVPNIASLAATQTCIKKGAALLSQRRTWHFWTFLSTTRCQRTD